MASAPYDDDSLSDEALRASFAPQRARFATLVIMMMMMTLADDDGADCYGEDEDDDDEKRYKVKVQ